MNIFPLENKECIHNFRLIKLYLCQAKCYFNDAIELRIALLQVPSCFSAFFGRIQAVVTLWKQFASKPPCMGCQGCLLRLDNCDWPLVLTNLHQSLHLDPVVEYFLDLPAIGKRPALLGRDILRVAIIVMGNHKTNLPSNNRISHPACCG